MRNSLCVTNPLIGAEHPEGRGRIQWPWLGLSEMTHSSRVPGRESELPIGRRLEPRHRGGGRGNGRKSLTDSNYCFVQEPREKRGSRFGRKKGQTTTRFLNSWKISKGLQSGSETGSILTTPLNPQTVSSTLETQVEILILGLNPQFKVLAKNRNVAG